jgi:hypothetical protein
MEGEAIANSLPALRSGRIIFANAETARRHLSVYAERTFQKEKAAVTNALPDAYKSRWKKWCVLDAVADGKGFPCYVLSPYDVPPGPHRTSWMEWFEQVRAFVTALCEICALSVGSLSREIEGQFVQVAPVTILSATTSTIGVLLT